MQPEFFNNCTRNSGDAGHYSAKNSIDAHATINTEVLQQMINSAVMNAFSSFGGQLLDNSISGLIDVSGGDTDMAKRIKQRATLGGKDFWVTGETQQDIFNAYLQHAIKEGIVMPTNNTNQVCDETAPLFGNYLLNFLNVYRDDQARTTINNRNHMVKRHILSRWGNVPMNEITTDALQKWFNELGKEYKQETLLKIKNHMSPALDSAVEDGLIKRNPFKSQKLKIKGKAGGHHKAIPFEKMKYIRAHLNDLPERERRMTALLAYTGMRMEEILGLRWEDLDFAENKIHIRRAVVHPKRNQAEVKDTLKTDSSRRDIPIQDKVIEGIQPLQASGFIVGCELPLTYQQQKRSFEKIRKAFGIEDYTAHDFRDTCATEWREAGMPLDIISKMLGHSNTKVTEKCYVKFRETGIEEARQYMQAM